MRPTCWPQNTVDAAITAASLTAQIRAENQLLAAEAQLLRTVRSQFELGGATGTDLATQEAQLANMQALVVPLQTQLQQARNQLAACLGQVPAEAVIPALELTDLTLPASLPISLSPHLVDQRPDFRAAEAQLHQATAQLGVAIGNRLPQFTLAGALGSSPAGIGNLSAPGNGIYSILTQTFAPLFKGGSLLHQQRAAEAAALNYRAAVVNAFQNVADVLTALQGDTHGLAETNDATFAAARSLSLAQAQYGAGGIANLKVLTSQTQFQNAAIALICTQAARYGDTVALYVALGGGWWNRSGVPRVPKEAWRSFMP